MSDSQPPFDEKFASQYIGKYVLIGITYYDKNNQPVRQEQMHGVIQFVSAKTGITVELKGVNEGRTYCLPPNIQSLKIAPLGDYTLRQTQEVVTDPDFLWTWNITENT